MYYIRFRRSRRAFVLHAAGCRYSIWLQQARAKTEWHGPFSSPESALEFAREEGRTEVSRCRYCLR